MYIYLLTAWHEISIRFKDTTLLHGDLAIFVFWGHLMMETLIHPETDSDSLIQKHLQFHL